MSKVQGLLSEIKNLSIVEVLELVETLQAEFGVSATVAPVAAAGEAKVGSATIENVERKGKKSATLVYNWEYDNAAKATFTQAGGSQKIPKTIQGESKLPVFIDDNDNVVGLKSN